jgi:hypothetical protein
VNASPLGPGGVIRQAVHHDFHKTVLSVPDRLLHGHDRRIWRDWSEKLRAVGGGSAVPRPVRTPSRQQTVPRLSPTQLADFKRNGYIVLPAALDADR